MRGTLVFVTALKLISLLAGFTGDCVEISRYIADESASDVQSYLVINDDSIANDEVVAIII